jgi:hypothetical protein
MKTGFRFWGATLFFALLLLLCLVKPLPHVKHYAQRIQGVNNMAAPFPASRVATNNHAVGTIPEP